MHKLLRLGIAAVLVAGCHKGGGSSGAAGSAATGGTPEAPSSTAEQDALWALAPDGAVSGFVLSPHGVAGLEHAYLAVQSGLAAASELASVKTELDQTITKALGKPFTGLADIGLSHDKGAAVFLLPHDGVVAVVPVADHDKFVAIAKGKSDKGVDTFGQMTCKTVAAVYACAQPASLLDTFGKTKSKMSAAAANARGDIESFGDIPLRADGPAIQTSAVVQLAPGAFVIRGAVTGIPATYTAMLGSAHKPVVASGTSAGFAIGDIRPLLALAPVPKDVTIPGTQVKFGDVLSSIGGPITLDVPAGEHRMDIHVPLTDPAPMTALIAQCETLGGALGAKLVNGACHISNAQVGGDMDLWVDGKELRTGKKGATGKGVAVELSALGKELADGEWAVATYGRGTILASVTAPPGLDAANPMVAPVLRGLGLLSEFDAAVKLDGSTVRYVVGVRTIWSNPDDVVAKLFAIPPVDITTGKAQTAAKAIADGAPGSPFAADFKAGEVGLMIPVAMIGAMAAVAVPAFMDYGRKSKKTEAQLYLNKLGKNSKVYFITNAEFYKGEVGPSPATPCCASPNHRCAVDPKTWTDPTWAALDFELDEPNLFQYSYKSDGKTVTATAVGDPNCDGHPATYTLTMSAADGNPTMSISEPTGAP